MTQFPRVQLRHLSKLPIVNGLGLPGSNDNPEWPRYIRTTDIASPTGLRGDVFASQPPEVASNAIVLPGDILMTAAGASIGKSVRFTESYPACFAGFLVRIRPRTNDSGRYLGYWLQSRDYWDQIAVGAVKSTIENFSASRYRALKVPFLPLEEQRAIADYLDQETAQIDALVAKQEEFIGLLRERRRTVLPSILRKANVADPRPDKLHRRTRIGNGSTPRSSEDRYYLDGEIAWVNSSVVNSPEVHEPTKLITGAAVSECHLPMVKSGSLLVALTGEGKTRGAATILRITSTINQHLAFIEPDARYWHPEYLLWLLRSNYVYLRRISSENGATKGGLTVGDLRALRLPMPSLDEQSRLVEELEDTTAQIEASIAKTEEHIALAKERRSALITAAVTGQFDVRTARKAG